MPPLYWPAGFRCTHRKPSWARAIQRPCFIATIQAGHWELADKYLTERYIQHNPNAASGRDGVVKYFTEVRKVKPVPIPAKMKTEVVAVVAEGDLVVVAYVRALKDATTTWFDMWRFKDGKADEHWDPATRTGP